MKSEQDQLLKELENIEAFHIYLSNYAHSYLCKNRFERRGENFHRYADAITKDVINNLIKEVELIICDKYKLTVNYSEVLGERDAV